MLFQSVARAVALGCLCTLALACAADAPGPAIPPPTPGGITPIRSVDLLPTRDQAGRFHVTTSSGTESDRDAATTLTPDGWNVWIRGKNRAYLQRGPADELLLQRDDSLNRDFYAIYDPPLLLLPPMLRDGIQATGKSRVTVYDLETGKEKTHGSIRYELTYVGQGPVKIGDRDLPGYTLRQRRQMVFPLFDVDMTVQIEMVPGIGVVSDRVWQRISAALGLYKQETSYHSERIE